MSIYSEQKERMARVGEPIVDVFLHEKNPEERRKILERIVAKCERLDKPRASTRCPGYLVAADHDYDTGITRVLDNSLYSTYSHELMHALNGNLRNDVILANAVESYMRAFSIDKHPKLPSVELTVKSLGNHRIAPKDSCDGTLEYAGIDRQGNLLGLIGAYLESGNDSLGTGLFFLSELNDGKTILEASVVPTSQRKEEMQKFLDKHGEVWYKMLGEEI